MAALVSIVMPCLNAESTVGECIDSILNQSYQHWELIAVNDGSTDSTLSILYQYADLDSRIRVIDSEKLGIIEAPMLGIAVAQGLFLARMDSDDVAYPERIERQVSYLKSHPEIALCGTHVSHIGLAAGEGRQRYLDWINSFSAHEDIVRELFVECPVAHPTSMMRKDAFDAIGGYIDLDWAEDYDLILRFVAGGYRLGVVAEPLLYWRHSEGRTSMTDTRYSLDRFRMLKRHYLYSLYLAKYSEFYQWGAGAVGKTWLKEWGDLRPKAVVDIAPRKIGKIIHDCLVINPEELPPPGAGFTVVAVGAPGARREIREWFLSRYYRENEDFLFLA
jgi:glycosyltransferase involved in cell wall biosynthesis